MDFTSFLPQFFTLATLVKIGILIVLFMYIVFTFVVFVQVRTMNRLIRISSASVVITVFSVIHILLAVSLFLLSIAIL